ncbi:hypothetical protein [Pseudomonas sp.]|uniref:hypothetical protein n=1 Tax=Pseudomonas sp. TaxID=306 RepID=UPI004053C2CD
MAAMFAIKDQEKADKAIDQWSMEAVGSEPDLMMAFQTVAPLLLENVAIRQWTDSNPQWKSAMPEVLTVGEAATLAQADYLLSEPQMEQLIAQLKAL